jgi:hypothetical protein
MIGDLVIEIEVTEPAIGKVEFDVLAQAALRTDNRLLTGLANVDLA